MADKLKSIAAVGAAVAAAQKKSETTKQETLSKASGQQIGTANTTNTIAPTNVNSTGSSTYVKSTGSPTYNRNFVTTPKATDNYINKNSPFANYSITSKTGSRNTGAQDATTEHAGIDRAMPVGTPISLPINTTYYASGYDSKRGYWIEVKDGNGNILHYQHLSKVGEFEKGAPIENGAIIALSGSTGVGTGPHLHEEYYSADGKNITESYWHNNAASYTSKWWTLNDSNSKDDIEDPEQYAKGIMKSRLQTYGLHKIYEQKKAYDSIVFVDLNGKDEEDIPWLFKGEEKEEKEMDVISIRQLYIDAIDAKFSELTKDAEQTPETIAEGLGEYISTMNISEKEIENVVRYAEYVNKWNELKVGGRSLYIRPETQKAIDKYVRNQGSGGNLSQKSSSLDRYLSTLDLTETEKEAAKAYAEIKKLEYFDSSDGEGSWWEETTQPVVKFFNGMYDAGVSASRTFKSVADKLGGEGDTYNQRYSQVVEYYENNPDKIFEDYLRYVDEVSTGVPDMSLSEEKRDYLIHMQIDGILSRYNDTNEVMQTISNVGFGSAGEMLGSAGVAGMFGLPEISQGASGVVGKYIGGTALGGKIAKVLSKTPQINSLSGNGVFSKIANWGIGKFNNLSVGKALSFLNPFENPTTLVMGVNAASEKYTELIKMGYDDETATKNAIFTGYVSAITEKMGYDGKEFGVGDFVTSGKKNAGNILKNYLSQNVSEGVEEIYNMVFERLGDKLMGVGYIDENGELVQRDFFGDGSVFDFKGASESFLGGFIGGAVMGGVGVISELANSTTKKVRGHADAIKNMTEKVNINITAAMEAAGITDKVMPEAPNWETATVSEMNDYFVKTVELYNEILNDERVKAYDEKIGEKMSVKSASEYSYENLASKGDIKLASLSSGSVYGTNGKIDRASVVQKGIENVRSKSNSKNTETNSYVYVPDVGRDILVTKDGLRHGLTRNADATAMVTQNIGDILENSIKVNELNSRKNTVGGYVMLGMAVDNDGNYYPVRTVINNYAVEDVEVLDVLYATKAKKKSQSADAAGYRQNLTPLIKGSSTISVADLLQIVKGDFSDVLSKDVLNRLGLERRSSTLSDGVRYTVSSGMSGNIQISESQIKFAEKLGLSVEADESLDVNGKIVLADGRIVYSPKSSIGGFELISHEVTHWLKLVAPVEYEKYIEILKTEFSDEWKAERTSVRRDYVAYAKSHPDVKVNAELINEETAARFAEKLDNQDFIEKVANSDFRVAGKIRNTIRNLIERIKSFFKKSDIGNNAEDIRRLLKAKKAWEAAAIKAAKVEKQGETSTAIRNSITARVIKAVQSVGRKSVNDFTSEDIKKTEAFARRYFEEMGRKSPFYRAQFGDWRVNDTQKVKVVTEKGATRGVHKNADTGWDIQVSGKVFGETQSHNQTYNIKARPYLQYIDSIVENAVLLDSYTVPSEKAKSANSAMMHSMYALADIGNGIELIKIYVEELLDVNTGGTIKRSYQLQNISATKNSSLKVRSSGNSLSSINQTADGYSISDKVATVKSKINNQQLNDRVQDKSLAPSALTADGYSVADLFRIVKAFDKNFNPKPTYAGIRYSFAGEKAETANLKTLDEAKALKEKGLSNEEIFRKTGWFVGQEGRWKFEISNPINLINVDKLLNNKYILLGDLIDNQALFEAYPHLGDIIVAFEDIGRTGQYNMAFDIITLNEKFLKSGRTESLSKTLLHEIQHAIQNYENFASGANPKYWEGKNDGRTPYEMYRNTAGEIEARDAADRFGMSDVERKKVFPESAKENENVVFSKHSVLQDETEAANGSLQNKGKRGIITDIPYREKRQLEDYILRKNHTSAALKAIDCKEIGDNFYVWHNSSKTDFDVVSMIEIEGNEDIIDVIGGRIRNGSNETYASISRWIDSVRGGKGGSALLGNNVEVSGRYGSDDSVSRGQSTSNKRGHLGENSRDIQQEEDEDLRRFLDEGRSNRNENDRETQNIRELYNGFGEGTRYSVGNRTVAADNGADGGNDGISESERREGGKVDAVGRGNLDESGGDTQGYNEVGRTGEQISVNSGKFREILETDKNKARKVFVEYYKRTFPKSVVNKDTNKEIGISRTGIDKFLSGNITKEKYATGFKIPELIENAKKVGEAENKKGKSGINGYEYYYNIISVDDTLYAVHIRIRNTDMGDKYYGHTISEIDAIKIEPLARSSDVDASVDPVNALGSNDSIPQKQKSVKYQSYDSVSSSITELVKEHGIERSTEDGEGTGDRIRKLINEYGAIPKGEIPARDVEVPQKDPKKKLVSRFARTAMEAGITPDENISDFERAILEGKMSHEIITNKKARKDAVKKIESIGFDEALRDWETHTKDNTVGKKQLALGMELYNQSISAKDVRTAMKLAVELSVEATRAGQTLQAIRMLKRMSPDGQLYYIEKAVQKMNSTLYDKLGDKHKEIQPDEEIMKEYLTAENEDARNEVYDKLCDDIAKQIPASFMDKWNAWRYLAMLGNPRTHIRNIVGNAAFYPALRLHNYIGAVIERAARVDKNERVHSFTKSKESKEFARKDFENMVKVLQGEDAKYAITSDIEGKRTIFKWNWLEKLRLKNFDWLEKEDMRFLKAHYIDALARAITARGIDVNNASADVLDEIRMYAVKEAQAATYRDANVLADALSKIQSRAAYSSNELKNVPLKVGGVLLEGVMPFKKTPLNIAKQAVNYSPIGVLNGIIKTLRKLHNGTAYSATEVIDTLSKGLSGTSIMLLGYFMSAMGWLVGYDDDEEKKRRFSKMLGMQDYAIKIGDATYTIDWMTPTCMPLFIGTELHSMLKDGDVSFSEVADAILTLTDPLLELSVLDGISDTLETIKYESDQQTLPTIISDMAISYFSQAFPSIGGQVSRMIDNTKRNYYYVDKNSNIPGVLQKFIGEAASKIPLASYFFPPQVDDWGREQTYGSIFERVMENTVSPGYFSSMKYTDVDKELIRLYEATGDSSVLPKKQDKYFMQDGESHYMSAENYAEAQKLRGRKSFELVEKFLKSDEYKKLDDEEKAKRIANLYQDAGTYAKRNMLDKVVSESSDIYSNYLRAQGGAKTDVHREYERLAEIDDSVVPKNVSTNFEYNNVEYSLSDEEHNILSDMYGYRAVQYRDAVINSSEYKAANDTVKIALMKKAMSQAEKDGKQAFADYKRTGEKSLKGEYVNPFEGKTIIGNSDTAEVYEAEGFTKGKGYAEVEIGGKEYILQGDKYNEYEKVRYETYTDKFDDVVENKTVTVRAKSRAEVNKRKSEVYRMILTLYEARLLSTGEANQYYRDFVNGKAIEVPAMAALCAGEKKEKYYKNLTKVEKESKLTSLKKKYKNGEITKAEYNAIVNSETPIEVTRYIVGDYRSLTAEQRDKVDAALNKKAKEAAAKAVDVG